MNACGTRNLLICVAGGTPQIVTKTVYALATKRPPVIPDEVIIITTKFGKEKIVRNLVEEGRWKRLSLRLGKALPDIIGESILIPTDPSGRER